MTHSDDRSDSSQRTLAAHHDLDAAVAGAVSAPGVLASSQPRIDPYLGRTLDGRYLIETMLGEGGMGVVYLGRHKVIDKRVAIKILRGDMAADSEMVERFLNEARAASSIGNPHIVDISDFGRLDDGSTYFVMEFLDGQGLGDLVANSGVIPVPRLVHIAKQIARGLAAAHARGIVHRDLKPDNIMLIHRGNDHDFVKVLDFGIAKVSSEAGKLTRAGSVFGTPHYMSPEQAAGVPVDHRTDIYSLGVILYEMASGKVPFDADNFMGILTQHMYKSPAPIRALVPQPQEVPPGLEAIVMKALSKRAELRYASMEELAIDLERVEQGMVPEAVQEMMGRSGGFNVPADYFRKQQVPGGPTMLPATPQQLRPRNSALKGAIAAAGTVVILVVGVLVATNLRASPKHVLPATADPSGSALPATATAPGSESAAPVTGPDPATLVRPVVVVTVPTDATVFAGTKNLGISPVTIPVPMDGTVKIRIEHPGYVTKEKTLDGSTTRESISLDRDFGKPNPRASAGKGPASPPSAKTVATPLPPPPPPPPSAKPAVRPPSGPEPCDLPKIRDPFNGVCK